MMAQTLLNYFDVYTCRNRILNSVLCSSQQSFRVCSLRLAVRHISIPGLLNVSLAEICGGLSVNGRGVGWNNDVQYLKEKENPTCKCTNQPNKYITSMVLSTVQIILSVE